MAAATHRHLLYTLSYKSKNVGHILALKTRDQHIVCVSSFSQQLFQGCLCKSMADSCREFLAKRRQSGLMTATVDDTESAVDVPTPTGKERCFALVASARRHRPRITLLPASTMSPWPSRRGNAAGCSATARRPVRTSPPAATYMRMSNFGRFLTSKEGLTYMQMDLCMSIT